jgi:mono/diheme cytochrome c family protein
MLPSRKIRAEKSEKISKAPKIVPLCAAGALLVFGAAMNGAEQQQRSARPLANSAGAANVAAGQKVYAAQCEACHFPHSAAKKVGPGLKGVYGKAKFANGKAVSDASMTAWIRDGGKDMPPLGDKINAEELRELLAYLRTL